MKKQTKIDCEYFLDGRCGGIDTKMREEREYHGCRSSPRDACCYVCNLGRDCTISCDFLETRQKFGQHSGEDKKPLPEQSVQARATYEVALDIYWISGLAFIALSLLFIIILYYAGYNYFERIDFCFFLLGSPLPSEAKSEVIAELFCLLLPIFGMIFGFFLAVYSRIKIVPASRLETENACMR